MDAPTTHYVITGLISLVMYFLKAENMAKARQIEELFAKHRELDASFITHKIKLAENYYDAGKLDQRFDKFDTTLEKIVVRLESIMHVACPGK